MPEKDKLGNTVYRTEKQCKDIDRGQQLGNIVRDYTMEQRKTDAKEYKKADRALDKAGYPGT